MRASRRDLLKSTIGITLAGCVSKTPLIKSQSERKPNSLGPLSGERERLRKSLSRDIGSIKNHYDTIIVGSGYGASVIAARLSGKISSLAILERGKEWFPGDFPETAKDLDSILKTKSQPLGLLDIEAGDDIDIVCASGLGGTSLINAAISIRPEWNVLQQHEWPNEIRDLAASGEIERFYQKAEEVLKPQNIGQGEMLKSRTHRKVVESKNVPYGELNLNVRDKAYIAGANNENDFPQGPCQQCGNCCSGCNFGAKNILPTNYLSLAYKNGAEIYTQVEVIKVEKVDRGYQLHLKIYSSDGEESASTISADRVFLGAGSKGSTQILMRSKSDKFSLSSKLGSRLSANGDVMGLAYNTSQQTNIIAKKTDEINKISWSNRPGPIIASYANYRTGVTKVQDQFLLLDGVIPSSFASSISLGFAAFALGKQGDYTSGMKIDKIERLTADALQKTKNLERGALNHSMLYFACGHDSSGGKFIYDSKNDSFNFVWKNVLQEPTIKRISQTMAEYAGTLGGVFIANPRSTLPIVGKKIQATHPLGGCPMGNDSSSGVVNHRGQVFKANGELYENLYVVDASIIPTSLAATPLLTITALSERIAELVLAELV